MYSTFDNIRNSLQLAWKYKILWVFAIMVAAGGTSQYGNSSSKSSDTKDVEQEIQKLIPDSKTLPNKITYNAGNVLGAATQNLDKLNIESFIPSFIFAGTALLIALIFGIIIGMVIRAWATGSLIQGTQVALDSGEVKLREISSKGRFAFRRLIYMDIVAILSILVITLVLVSIPAVLLIIKQDVLGYVTGGLAIIIFLILILSYAQAYLYSYRYIVLKDKGVKEGLRLGFRMFFKNVGLSFKLAIANCLVQSVITLIAFMVLGLVLALPFAGVLNGKTIDAVQISVGIFFGIPLIIAATIAFTALGGYLGTFTNISWTNLFNYIERRNENGN